MLKKIALNIYISIGYILFSIGLISLLIQLFN